MNGSEAWSDFVDYCVEVVAAHDFEPRTLADARKIRDQLEQRVAALPEVCRLIIGLYFCHGMGLREIGRVLDLPQGELRRLFDESLRVMRDGPRLYQEGAIHG
jgi:DNA-directed RNA polymerase specialized sigma24 family protein